MRAILLAIFVYALFIGASKSWTPKQIQNAHTAKSVSYMNAKEKETILYLNLVRLYPKNFWFYECADYKGDGLIGKSHPGNYIRSLKRTLRFMKPTNALQPDSALYNTAKCLVLEQGKTKRTGHKRYKCEADYRGECISYGMDTGADVLLQLLFDVDVPNLGHRKLCLNTKMKLIGVSFGDHKKYDTMSVLNFK